MKKSIFDQFVNQYALSKTLRFELKPVGETGRMLEEAKVFAKDETIKKKYEATKPFFNKLHREFVEEALNEVELAGLPEYFEIFKYWKRYKKKFEKDLQKKEKELRKSVVGFFNAQAKEWAKKYETLGVKKKDVGLLFEENVFAILKERYGNEEGSQIVDESTGKDVSIFDSWKGFTGYFIKFQETRKNFYKDDGTATALATRIIDQNLKRFCDNLLIFESIRDKIDFSEVEQTMGNSIDKVFSVIFYSSCLLQEGIDFYNCVLGGETLPNGEKRQGINELINLYRQKTSEKVPFLKLLDKQILSEKEKFMDEIENDEALLDTLKIFRKSAEEKTTLLKNIFGDFVMNQGKYDLAQIYISRESLNTISRKWTSETDIFEDSLYEVLKKSKIVSASVKKKDGGYAFPEFIALIYVKSALEQIPTEKFWKERYYKNIGDVLNKGFLNGKEGVWLQFLLIFDFEFNSLFEREIIDENGDKKVAGYNLFAKGFDDLLNNFKYDQKAKVVIKDFADEVLHIYQMGKYFAIEKKRSWLADYDIDSFYTDPEKGYLKFYENAYEEIIQVYNKLRNYLTKKPYSEDKWKLNFENPTLADGWDKNKEADNSTVILKKDGRYYLGLMARGRNKLFDDRNLPKILEGVENGKYEKVVYKYFPDQAKMFPKVCFSTKGLEFFQPSEEVITIYKNSEFKKGYTFNVRSMQRLIDFYKDCLVRYEGWQCYDFRNLRKTEDYRKNIEEFFSDVAMDGYKISFQDVSESYIKEKNQNGDLYLFEIKNKDWNEGANGKKNLHTIYFESLFSADNIAMNFPVKLNGQAEIFYRPRTEGLEKERIITKKGNVLEKGDKAFHKRRYTENKVFFHVPITLNRTKKNPFQFNAKINDFLAKNSDINVIGVDRGEKQLAYFSVISQRGKILDRGSLNVINGVNYAEKLEEKARGREQARKDWQQIEGIKDLKKGYISQVVRKLADLAIQYNAIIVFEDLNMRFKQIRGGIEKSVYQQLEKALIDKLTFLVEKEEKDVEKAGHLLKAYQLAAPFETFQKMGKQTGIVFYTQAAYTSRIDPVTGWRPHLYLKYSSAEKAKADLLKFKKIKFVDGRFEFTYDIKSFREQKEHPKATVWTVCSCVERFRWNRYLNSNKGGYDHYSDVTKFLVELFQEYGIDFERGDIVGQIEVLETKGNEKFFKNFVFFFNLICQIRNTNASELAKKDGKDDFILSPVEPFFDSRNSEKFGEDLPKNGDDNGAFNIARKGLVIMDKITKFADENGGCEKMKWGDLYVSNVEWDNFVANK